MLAVLSKGALGERHGGSEEGAAAPAASAQHTGYTLACSCKPADGLQLIRGLPSVPVTHSRHLSGCPTGKLAAELQERRTTCPSLPAQGCPEGRKPQTHAAGRVAPDRPRSSSLCLLLSVWRKRQHLPRQGDHPGTHVPWEQGSGTHGAVIHQDGSQESSHNHARLSSLSPPLFHASLGLWASKSKKQQ